MERSVTSETSNHFRRRRLRFFLQIVDQLAAKRQMVEVIDIGGTQAYWLGMEADWRDRPLRFTIVNLSVDEVPADDRFTLIAGDACNLSQFSDHQFDIVHSNSVIEHVGQWSAIRAMAGEVRRLAPSYFLQTPNVWFPLEPHYRLAFYHWLPEQMRVAMLRRIRPNYFGDGFRMDKAMELVERINLLSVSQLRSLFPDARIERERVLGLTKSLIAIRE